MKLAAGIFWIFLFAATWVEASEVGDTKTRGYFEIGAPDFEPDHWSPGIHLLAGVGANISSYHSREENIDGGLGSNLKTDLLYVINPHFALEWGANVSFHRVRGSLIWDTPLTLGVRFQLPKLVPSASHPYMRLFTGASPTVVFIKGNAAALDQLQAFAPDGREIDRLNFNGPVAGIGLGSMRKNSQGLVWYTEFTLAAKWVEQEERIIMQGEVPVVVSSSSVDRNTMILSIYWTIGVLAF